MSSYLRSKASTLSTPWVSSRVFLLFACFCFFYHNTEARNCTAVTVPTLETHYYHDGIVEFGWEHSIPNATYSISSCCNLDPGYYILTPDECTECPVYSSVNKDFCKADHEKKSACTRYRKHTRQHRTLNFTLTVNVSGCESKSRVSSKYISIQTMRYYPVENLTVQVKDGHLLASWIKNHKIFEKVCYFYHVNELFASGEKHKIKNDSTRNSKTTDTGVPIESLHAYKLFEFCVKVQNCGVPEGPFSEERCEEIRTPASAPSKPLEMLCGQNDIECPTVMNNKERNVTLVWKNPEKSTWNGIPTVIKIYMKFESKERNNTSNITINASRNNYTLTGLKKDRDYEIQLDFCSNGGCAITTRIALFKIQERAERQPKTGDEFDSDLLITVIVTSLVVIIVGIMLVIYGLVKRRNQSKNALPHLQAPAQDTSNTGTDPSLKTNPAEYDCLLSNSEESCIQNDFLDKQSLDDKNSTEGSSSAHSSNGSASSPFFDHTADTSPDEGYDDVTYYPENNDGSESSGDHTIDI